MKASGILLVEDEALIRMMIAEMVEELGHRVVAEAGNVETGCELAQNASFDLALLDINLDGSSSAPVAEIIEKRGLPFLFVSGYGLAGLPQGFRERPVLQKPFPSPSSATRLARSSLKPERSAHFRC
jgi:CheY-like chemotaxis protein